jgi:hypothetical protein
MQEKWSYYKNSYWFGETKIPYAVVLKCVQVHYKSKNINYIFKYYVAVLNYLNNSLYNQSILAIIDEYKESLNYTNEFDSIDIDFNPTQKGDTMKTNHLISLLQEDYTTVKVRFSQDNSKTFNSPKLYTYKTREKFSVDDYAVVMVAGHLQIVKVEEVDDCIDLDFDSGIEYRWIVQRIDLANYETLMEQEKEVSDLIRKAENKQKLKQLRENMEDLLKDSPEILNRLSFKKLENKDD